MDDMDAQSELILLERADRLASIIKSEAGANTEVWICAKQDKFGTCNVHFGGSNRSKQENGKKHSNIHETRKPCTNEGRVRQISGFDLTIYKQTTNNKQGSKCRICGRRQTDVAKLFKTVALNLWVSLNNKVHFCRILLNLSKNKL